MQVPEIIEIRKKDVSSEEWQGENIYLQAANNFIKAIRKAISSNNDLVRKSMCKNVKIRVTPEQSSKIQEICFQNGVFWRLQIEAGDISYTNEPFLFIDKEITFAEANEEHYFRTHRFREVPADLFIRTNGTCEEEATEPQDKTEQSHRQAGGKPLQYQIGIDTFERSKANQMAETRVEIAKFMIDKYNWRNKGQDIEDFQKIKDYCDFAIEALNEIKG